MKRKMFTTFMVIGLILFMPSQASAITYAKGVILDGEQVKMEVLPVIENGRTLVPLRGLFESMEASVTWDQSTKDGYGLLRWKFSICDYRGINGGYKWICSETRCSS